MTVIKNNLFFYKCTYVSQKLNIKIFLKEMPLPSAMFEGIGLLLFIYF